jgi:Glycosyl transferase family 2
MSTPTPDERYLETVLTAVDTPPARIPAPPRPDLGDYSWAAPLRAQRREANAPTITGIVHTRNEERNLPDALCSLEWVDELLVVDMESDDRTVEIAREFGAKIMHVPNVGYVEPARNAAVTSVRTDWICIVDADERVPEQLARTFDRVSRENLADVVQVLWRMWVAGRFLENSGWRQWQTRFFRTGSVEYSSRIHSLPQINGRVAQIPFSAETALIHLSYDDLTHFVEKLNRYTDREAEGLDGEAPMAWPQLMAHLRQEFAWHWTPAQDGPLSAALAVSMLYYRFIAQAKHWQRLDYPDVGVPASSGAALRDLAHDGRVLHEAGIEAAEDGRLADAVELLRRSVREQLDPETLNDLAVLCTQSGQDDKALALLRACVAVAPDFTVAQDNLAALVSRQADDPEA